MKNLPKAICLHFLLTVLFLAAFHALPAETKKPLKITLLAENNGFDPQNGRVILKTAIEDLGHTVELKTWSKTPNENDAPSDINIFFEHLNPKWFPNAKLNWFIPNPEWYNQDLALLDNIDLILCRNHNVEKIFQALNKKTYYLGFSSRDCLKSEIRKDYSKCLHLVGMSIAKGTPAVVKAWKNDTSMPNVVIVIQRPELPLIQKNVNWIADRLPFEEVLNYQNSCAIHLCPSEVEGFGHNIMEAMSTKAVVITTDAPPMNEFITDKRCLVPYREKIPVYLGTRYMPNSSRLKKIVKKLTGYSKEKLKKIGEQNRERYLQLTREFHGNLKTLLENPELNSQN